jgi:hypothetical protein
MRTINQIIVLGVFSISVNAQTKKFAKAQLYSLYEVQSQLAK